MLFKKRNTSFVAKRVVAFYVTAWKIQWAKKTEIAIFDHPTLIWRPFYSEPSRISTYNLSCYKL